MMRRALLLVAALVGLSAMAEGVLPLRYSCPTCTLLPGTIVLPTTGRIYLDGVSGAQYLYSPDDNSIRTSGDLILGGNITSGGGNYNSVHRLTAAGINILASSDVADGVSATSVEVLNTQALSSTGARAFTVYSDNESTIRQVVKKESTGWYTEADFGFDLLAAGTLHLGDKNATGLAVPKVVTYNAKTTAGQGVAPIVAYGTQAAITSNATTVATFTPGGQGLFRIGGFVAVTSFTSGTVGLTAAWTDCHGSAVSHTMFGQASAGGTGTTINSVTTLSLASEVICSNAAAITLSSANTGTATADYFGTIEQLN